MTKLHKLIKVWWQARMNRIRIGFELEDARKVARVHPDRKSLTDVYNRIIDLDDEHRASQHKENEAVEELFHYVTKLVGNKRFK